MKNHQHTKPTVGQCLRYKGTVSAIQMRQKSAALVLHELGFGSSYAMTSSVIDFAPITKQALLTPITKSANDTRDFIWLCKQVSRFYYSGLFDNIKSLMISVHSPNAAQTASIVDPKNTGKPFFFKLFTNPETCNSYYIGFNYE